VGEPVPAVPWLSGSFTSAQRTDGTWDLSALVFISNANSSECYEGTAHLAAHHATGPDDAFNGGKNFVRVSTRTPTEVTGITYQLYFDGCACYSPESTAPK
jgi:hypothetical protein